jgi:hypothetical protein
MTGLRPTFYFRCGALSTCAAAPASHWSSCGTHPPISSGRTGATLPPISVLLRGLSWLLSGNVHCSLASRDATLLKDFRRIESGDEFSDWTAEATHLFLLSFCLGKRAHYTLASGWSWYQFGLLLLNQKCFWLVEAYGVWLMHNQLVAQWIFGDGLDVRLHIDVLIQIWLQNRVFLAVDHGAHFRLL